MSPNYATPAEPSLAATGETPQVADRHTGDGRATDTHTRLQEILPEISGLAQRVGGFDQLAEIIETLRHTEEA